MARLCVRVLRNKFERETSFLHAAGIKRHVHQKRISTDNLGGPAFKDKLFFFSLERFALRPGDGVTDHGSDACKNEG